MEDSEYTKQLLPAYAFWDVDGEKLDFTKDKEFIISRMFERGKLDDVLSIVVFYGQDETRKVLCNNKYLARKGLFLAHALLGVSLANFKAYDRLK